MPDRVRRRAPVEVAADYVIDCTGLEADVAEHRVLARPARARRRRPQPARPPRRRAHLRAARDGQRRRPALRSGAATLGGYFPGVDTFLGLQIAAQEITDDLARRGMCNRIGPPRSIVQWLKWVTGREI